MTTSSTVVTPDVRAVRRARIAVYGYFILAGALIGVWTARIPTIKQDLGLSEGQLGIALLGMAAGALTATFAVGRLIDRFGSARIVVPAGVIGSLLLAAPGYAGNVGGLFAALFILCVMHSSLDVSMNAHAVEVERAHGRPLMSSFHAGFSLGGFLGAVAGALFASLGASVPVTFWTAGILSAVICLLIGRLLLPRTASPHQEPKARPGGRRLNVGVVLLGGLALAAMVSEGSAADWSGIYLYEDLNASAGLAAMGFAVFSIAMTAGRLAGDRLAELLGPVRLVRGSGLLAAAGLTFALLVGEPIPALIGFVLFGFGLACIVPQVFSAAGNRDPARAGQAIAQVAGIGYAGFLGGPILIGLVAEVTGLPLALGIPVLLSLFVVAAAPAVRGDRAGGQARSGGEPA
ncbi:MFS transporter [Rhizohabitans arisaemae]|uniref:MFS transporter n=1 Tax=Rhizohabitans arisaemae TaxID=2720610 RepID=UPI0024B222C2|nr:MFS transporter [Rhizohabitans arisaemae]